MATILKQTFNSEDALYHLLVQEAGSDHVLAALVERVVNRDTGVFNLTDLRQALAEHKLEQGEPLNLRLQ